MPTLNLSLPDPISDSDSIPNEFEDVPESLCLVRNCPSPQCAVQDCNSGSRNAFPFPEDINLLQAWLQNCKKLRGGKVNNAKICSSHFCEDDFERETYNAISKERDKLLLKKDAVPSLNLGSELAQDIRETLVKDDTVKLVSASEMTYSNRMQNRRFKRVTDTLIKQAEQESTKKESVGVQCNDFECCDSKVKLHEKTLQCQNMTLVNLKKTQTIFELKKSVKRLNSKSYKSKLIEAVLEKAEFSKAERKSILKPNQKRVMYGKEDIVKAIVLRGAGAKAYETMRANSVTKLPHRTTIERWLRNIKCAPGFQNEGIRILKEMGKESKKPTMYKYGVLCFDEVAIKPRYEMDMRTQTIYPPANKLQMVMLRGLCLP